MPAMRDQSVYREQQRYGIDQSRVPPAMNRQATGFEQRLYDDIPITEHFGIVANLYEKIAVLDSEIKKIRRDATGFIKIHFLPHKRLLCPLDAVLEPDENGYIARTAEIPLYGTGDTPEEAVEMLKREIESLYDDLLENDQFTEEWLRIKSFLMECIADS